MKFAARLCCGVCLSCIVQATVGRAQQIKWSASADFLDPEWALSTNWSPTTVPVDGDSVVFDVSTSGTTLMDITVKLSGYQFNFGTGSAFVKGNNGFNQLSFNNANISIGSSALSNTVLAFGLQSSNRLPIEFDGNNTIFTHTSSQAIVLWGNESGTGNIAFQGPGILTFDTDTVFAGMLSVTGGTVTVASNNSLASAVVNPSSGSISITAAAPVFGALTGSGNISLSSSTLTVGGNNSNQTFSGILNGSGTLVKTGIGVLTLSGTSGTWTGGTKINGGTLSIGNELNLGPVPSSPTNNIVFDATIGGVGGTLQFTNDVTLSANRKVLLARVTSLL